MRGTLDLKTRPRKKVHEGLAEERSQVGEGCRADRIQLLTNQGKDMIAVRRKGKRRRAMTGQEVQKMGGGEEGKKGST